MEGSESLTIAGSGTGLNVTGASLSLTDDDTAPAVNLSVSPASITEGATDPLVLTGGGPEVTVTATFSPANTYAYDRTVAVSVGGSGTAASGTDYDAVSTFNVKISAGQTSGTGTFRLTSDDDDVYEGSETIGIAGTAHGSDRQLGDPDPGRQRQRHPHRQRRQRRGGGQPAASR